jgi:hypothetical protein
MLPRFGDIRCGAAGSGGAQRPGGAAGLASIGSQEVGTDLRRIVRLPEEAPLRCCLPHVTLTGVVPVAPEPGAGFGIASRLQRLRIIH